MPHSLPALRRAPQKIFIGSAPVRIGQGAAGDQHHRFYRTTCNSGLVWPFVTSQRRIGPDRANS
jgi:hypothetical protein